MKALLFNLLFFMSAIAVNAQNLIPDPGFEDYDTCPKTLNMGRGLEMKYWFAPTFATSDYYNVCANSFGSVTGVPSNQHGYQTLSEGNFGYCGFHVLGNVHSDYKEYISNKLITPLVVGTQYKVSIKVSLAEKFANVGTDNLGAYFFTDSLPSQYKNSWQATLPQQPQITYSSYGCITDTFNWVTLIDTFTADSAYKYIIVGGVKPIQLTNRIRVKQDANDDMAYYYIDHVSVEAISTADVRNVVSPGISVFPNPIKDKATIRIPNSSGRSYCVQMVDVTGRLVWQRTGFSGNEVIFERNLLPAGIYHLRMAIEGAPIQYGKVVVSD